MSGRYQVPAAVQPLVDSRGLITNPWWAWALSIGKNAGDPIEWSNIVNTPTSLGGYGITDAYTKTQVDSMFSGLATVYQPLSSNLTAYAGGDLPSAFTLSIVDAADAAAWRTAIGAGTSSFDGAFSSLSGIPTTISGYGITDAYTETEVDTLLLDYATITSLAPVAFSGDYDDLTNIPAILSEFTGLTDAAGVLTNDGSGNLSWGSGGSTYTAGDGLTLVSDEFSVDESFAFVWTAQHIFTHSALITGLNGGGSAALRISNALPRIRFTESDVSAENKEWYIYTNAGAFNITTANDALSATKSVLQATRSGNAVSAVVYGNNSDFPANDFYGRISIHSGTSGAALVLNNTNANGTYQTFSRSGTPYGWVGNGGQMGSNFALDALALVGAGRVQIGNSAPAIDIGSSRNITLGPPASGTAVVVDGAGTAPRLHARSPSNESSVIGLFSGPSQAVRIGTTTGLAVIDGVDPTGSVSYQPLRISGSTLGLAIAGTGALTIDANRAVSINAPSSGNSLTVTGVVPANASARAVAVNVVGGDSRIGVATSTSGNASLNLDTLGVQNWAIINRRSDGALVFSASQNDSVVRGTVTSGGTWELPTPASGNTLVVNGINGNTGIRYNSNSVSVALGYVTGTTAFIGTITAHQLNLLAGNASRITISSAGNIAMNAPSSGPTLALSQASGQAAWTATDGAVITRMFMDGNGGYIGTTDAYPFVIQTNSANRVVVNDGAQIGSPIGGDKGVGTLNTQGNIFLNNNPVPCIVSGGAAGGGRITIHTSTPTGVPADGDIWIQRAA